MDCSMVRAVGCFTDCGSKLFRYGAKSAMVCSTLEKSPSSRLRYSRCLQRSKRICWETMAAATPVGLDAEPFPGGDVATAEGEEVPEASFAEEEEGAEVVEGDEDHEDDDKPKLMTPDELRALLVDGERKRLAKKLSEANQHNRFLKRELQKKDEDLINIKTDLALLEAELQDLVTIADEIADADVATQPSARKVKGKPIQSYLATKLESVRTRLQKQIEGVELIKLQEVTLHWVGMAESVQVMGSFDGWSQGEDMSPEYDGSFARFSATLKLRPGRYEVKFLVDGVWQLSPELPTAGEGLMKNNLLVL